VAAAGAKTLALRAELQITRFEMAGQSPTLVFHTFSGQQYSVEYSPDLRAGNWVLLPSGFLLGDGNDVRVTDTNALNSATARFYRVKASAH